MSEVTLEVLRGLLNDRRRRSQRLQTDVHPLSLKRGFIMPDPYPPPASDEELVSFELNTGVKLPRDVEDWLRVTNGASGFFGTGSDQHSIAEVWGYFPRWKQQQWIPISQDDFGNYYVKPSEGKPVCFVEGLAPNELQYAVASDTLRFAQFWLEEEASLDTLGRPTGWPFNEQFVLARDPDLAAVSPPICLPWSA